MACKSVMLYYDYWIQSFDAYAQINEACDKSVPKTNTSPVLIKRKQDDKKDFI